MKFTKFILSHVVIWVRKIPQRREWLPTPVFLPLSNCTERGAWRATVHKVAEADITERLTRSHPISPALFVEKTLLSLLNYLGKLVECSVAS